MRTISMVMAAVVVAAGATWAADTTAPTRPARERFNRGDRFQPGKVFLERLARELNLTDDQKQKVGQILENQKQANIAWTKEHAQELKGLQDQVQQARQAKDENKLKDLRAQIEKIHDSHIAIRDNLIKQLGEVLTKDQMEKARQFLKRREEASPFAALRKLKLDEKQRASIEEITKAAKADATKATDPAEKEKIWKAAFNKIRATVLTEEQKKQFDAFLKLGDADGLKMPGLEKLNLTDEQKAKVQGILQAAKVEAQKADRPAAKFKILADARKQVFDTVLTEDQRKTLEEWRKSQGNRPHAREGHPASAPTTTA